MLVVAALGPSALASPDCASLEARVSRIADALAPLAANHTLVVTHAAGEGGFPAPELPGDLRAAQAAGLLGHLLARELRNRLPTVPVLSLLVQAVVHRDEADVPLASAALAPCRIVEMPMLRELAAGDDRVLCVGCAPVRLDAQARHAGIDTALDYDQVAATIGVELGADILLLLADVAAIHPHWPSTQARLAQHDADCPVPAALDAHIGGKLQAACRFARTRGTFAVIGCADEAEALVAGRAGTRVSLPG
jgi:carbamate kinase